MRTDPFGPGGDMPHLVLSERNVRALLEKLGWASARTIVQGDNTIAVSIEPDDVHYGSRDVPPGVCVDASGRLF